MRSVADIIWYVVFGLFLFFAGIVYQWHFAGNPQYPFSAVAATLDDAKENLSETLRLLGLRKPAYYYQTSFTKDDNFVDAAAAQPGLTLITQANSDFKLEARVVELDGSVVQHWTVDWFEIWPGADHLPTTFVPQQKPGTNIHGAVIMDNGDLVFNFDQQGAVRMNVCGEVVWRLPHQTHHSMHVDERTGHLWVAGKRFHEEADPSLPTHQPTFGEPTVVEMTADGEILNEVSVFGILKRNGLDGLMMLKDFSEILARDARTTGDTLHLNDVEVFPADMKPGHFKPGDVMLSLRNIHTVLVYDPETLDIKFISTGNVIGQHDPDFLDGDRIAVFDNHVARQEEAAKHSRVVILNAPEGDSEVYFQGSAETPYYTEIMGKQQWLPNGNLLLTEATKGRALELDNDKNIVWQQVNLVDDDGWVGLMGEAQRLPLSFDRAFFEKQQQACAAPS